LIEGSTNEEGAGAGALLGLAGRLSNDDRFDDARAALEEAFAALRAAGDVRGSARAAGMLAGLHAGPLGNEATGPSYRGDGSAQLRALAEYYRAML